MGKFLVITKKHIVAGIVVLLLLAAGVSLVFFERSYRDRFYPNSIVGGQAVGGKTLNEVLARMKLTGEALKTNGLQLIVPAGIATTTITIPQQSVGLTPDVVVEYFSLGDYEETVREAFSFGHTGSVGRRLREQLSLLVRPHSVALPVALRGPAVESLLVREFSELLKKPYDAHFIKISGGITMVPESAGERVDVPAVIAGITEALTAMSTNRLQLTVLPQPPRVTAAKLGEIADFAREVADHVTLALTYRENKVYVSGATLATWLSIKPEPGVSLIIERDKVAEFIRRNINDRIDDAPKNSRFAMRDGVLVETQPGAVGSVASIEAVAASLETTLTQRYLATVFPARGVPVSLRAQTISVPVVFIEEQPRITAATVAQYNIKDLVGSATTSFKGSTASRIHNIKTGVDRSSGILIAPGEEFSLVNAIGEVSEETGFDKEYVIKGDRSVKEAGGGLCQLATTVFRGVLNAGLPVTERRNHSYVVGYYGPGLDATIYGPHPDLKFVNDTGQYLLFQMRVSGTNLISEFYGKKDARQAVVTEPKFSDYIDPPADRFIPDPESPWGKITCTDQPRKGLTAEATYAVTYPNGEVKTQEFKSVYQPWPKICLVGIRVPQAP